MDSKTFCGFLFSYMGPIIVGLMDYQTVSLFGKISLHYILVDLLYQVWLSAYVIFSQNIRDGEQNLLSVLNLIYVAHNGRGVGLPDCLPFLSKFHYIEFSMTCSTRCVCQLTQFFLKTSAMESKTFCGFLFSFMWAHNGRGVGLPDYLPFLEKFHYVEF